LNVFWDASATTDVARIVSHISEENPFAAQRVAREIVLAADSLAIFPRRGRVGRIIGTRELVVSSPYIIVYQIEDDSVQILRVWHGAQDRP
jgi:addiction module RelE/StbE family toxin